jgi:hypothetical protein
MTVKKQLLRLPKKYAMLALYNLRRVRANEPCSSVRDAIDMGFGWSSSRQGHQFWQQVANWAQENLDNQPKEKKLPEIHESFKKTIMVQSRRVQNSALRRIQRREGIARELAERPVEVVEEPQAEPQQVFSDTIRRVVRRTPIAHYEFHHFELPRGFFDEE